MLRIIMRPRIEWSADRCCAVTQGSELFGHKFQLESFREGIVM
jgi:hypothetical protein